MPTEEDFARLYRGFEAPISQFDCGEKCAPYNGGVPVCCDTRHSVPTAYHAEWSFLQKNTGLWHLWEPEDPSAKDRLAREAGPDLVLIECLGATRCERDYRSLTCRAFPFFPYLDTARRFLGLSCYDEYEDRCWVLSNLHRVTPAYRRSFTAAYERLFERMPSERETFASHSAEMRRRFGEMGRAVPLLQRDGGWVLVDPDTEHTRPVDPAGLEKHGPYAVADRLRFPGEN